MDVYFIFNSLTAKQQIKFYINLIEFDFDINKAYEETIKAEFVHEELDCWLSPSDKMVIGSDFVEIENPEEPDEPIVENFIHLYSSNKSNIDEYIKELMEDGEILTTVEVRKNFKLRHYRCLHSLNFENNHRPIVPIVYN